MFYIFLFSFFFPLEYCNGNELFLSNAVRTSGLKYYFESYQHAYSFDLKVTKDGSSNNSELSAFPNIIQMSNISLITVPADSVTLRFPIQLFFGIFNNFVNCFPKDGKNDSCEARFPNGRMSWSLTLLVNPIQGSDIYDYLNLFIHDGKIYDSKNGMLFTKEQNCSKYDEDFNSYQHACSHQFDSTEFPVSNQGQCNTFQTNATINDAMSNKTIQFTANFKKSNKNWTISIEILKAPKAEYYYNLVQNGVSAFGCRGNNTAKKVTCSFNEENNAIYEMVFSFWDFNGTKYGGLIVGEIISAFGQYYKNLNIPYTPSDPCWSTSSSRIPFSGAKYNAQFCCTKFDNNEGSAVVKDDEKKKKTTTTKKPKKPKN